MDYITREREVVYVNGTVETVPYSSFHEVYVGNDPCVVPLFFMHGKDYLMKIKGERIKMWKLIDV